MTRPTRATSTRDFRSAATLVLIRHGESELNAADCFTGRLDVGLTPVGARQAEDAAALIDHHGISIGRIVTSPMLRARQTAAIIADVLGIPAGHVIPDEALVERDYGALTGMPKSRALRLLGPERYRTVRRTLDGAPPAAAPGQVDATMCLTSTTGLLPDPGAGEPLRDVVERVRNWWDTTRATLEDGHGLLVVAHGNSLRALCAAAEGLTPTQVEDLNIPACQPLVYQVRRGDRLEPPGGCYLDLWNARHAIAAIARTGGT